MSTELEAKFKVAAHEPVRKALTAAGAEHLGRVLESNHILDRPDGSFRAQGKALRVRAFDVLEGPPRAATLTYKGPVQASRYKSRSELEVEVADAETALSILQAAGFVVALLFEKRRETWRAGQCLVELDELPLLGRFVEIEGPTESAIAALQDQLGLGHLDHVASGYVAMLARHCAEHNLPDRSIRFEA